VKKKLTKATTLKFLQDKGIEKEGIKIPKFHYFKIQSYKNKKKKIKILKQIYNQFKKGIIIRSSGINEDQKQQSSAGKYLSIVLKKITQNKTEKGIELVIKKLKNKNDQIIIQEFIENPTYTGVIFTRDPKNNTPFNILSLDRSGRSDLITSGTKNLSLKTFYISHSKKNITKFNLIINKINIIQKKLKNDKLDIEFLIKKDQFFLLQARPLIIKDRSKIKNFDEHYINIEKKINKLKKDSFNRVNKLALSNMADWNPAEMIGENPKPLAFSLYQILITNKVWAEQRKNYGYKDLTNHILMYNLYGKPFINLQIDFASFIPNELSKALTKKIITRKIKELEKKKYLHDKIEFDIIDTCYNLQTSKNINFLNSKEKKIYLNALKKITNNILTQNFLNDEIHKIEKIDTHINSLKSQNLSPIQNIYSLIKICQNYGTLPFAGLARCAFVGTNLLRSLRKEYLIDDIFIENFYENISSISKDISRDSNNLWKNKNSKINFLKKYGHIRPNTYSIDSKNYKENLFKYFPKNSYKNKKQKKSNLKNNNIPNKIKIDKYLKKSGLKINFKQLLNFSSSAIKLREYSKYKFTKCIDEIFKNIIQLGLELKISRTNLEFIDINWILDAYSNLRVDKLSKEMKIKIKDNKLKYKLSKRLVFPDLIMNSNDIYEFETSFSKGNFFTNNVITKNCIKFTSNINLKNLENKIVLIENADPGYDFIFSTKIAGLVTKYGGANSHMAIRCLEENIPSCIGVGTSKYENIIKSKTIELDCKNKIINIIR
jgi:phosphohistidine swiveling domain-containing protein